MKNLINYFSFARRPVPSSDPSCGPTSLRRHFPTTSSTEAHPTRGSERERGETMMKGRVVLFPTPGAGHLVSMIELAKQILHHTHNLSITILVVQPPSSAPFAPSSVISQHQDAVAASGLDINFMELPQVAPPEVEGRTSYLAYMDNHKPVVSEALAALQQTTIIPAFIADMFCISSTTASVELGIPTFVFFTSGATTLCLFLYLPEMDRRYEQDFKDVTEAFEFPGSVQPLPLSAMPSVLQTKKEEPYQWFMRNAHLYCGLDGILVNTFNELQPRAIEAFADGLCCPGARAPPVYPVGPLLSLGAESDSNDHDCIKWLDQQPHSSILFLCFGSMGAFPTEQIHEISRGLELSGQRFLWSIRVRPSEPGPGFVGLCDADLDEVLPDGFVERTRERGLVWPKWVPQVAILSHPAVGGFVSHCGWNSTLESMWFGVPMIAWPLYAEQGMNAFELVDVLGVGLALNREDGDGSNGMVRAEELERAARSLIEGEEGRKVREKMKEMQELGRKAVEEGGSSYLNLATLVEIWSTGGIR
ncbi:UDP-glycosyltransferase 88B1-like [Nymphaea colorata]|nr:UDP-glycosyltransferase 88B1-like [Nymphaea colorata]